MPDLTVADASRLAISAPRGCAKSRKMPSGVKLDTNSGALQAEAADTLEVDVRNLQ